jgi:hypothetical protein
MTRRRLIDRLKHAFAVEDADAFTPTEHEREIATRVCREVVRRRMTTPALMLLEMSRPMNFLGAQALHFFKPFGSVFVEAGSWEAFAGFVERRGSVEFLCRTLEDEAAAAAGSTNDVSDGPAGDADA